MQNPRHVCVTTANAAYKNFKNQSKESANFIIYHTANLTEYRFNAIDEEYE